MAPNSFLLLSQVGKENQFRELLGDIQLYLKVNMAIIFIFVILFQASKSVAEKKHFLKPGKHKVRVPQGGISEELCRSLESTFRMHQENTQVQGETKQPKKVAFRLSFIEYSYLKTGLVISLQ